jgi:hypothetical protein
MKTNTLRYGINYRTIRYHQKLACDLATYRGIFAPTTGSS